MLRQIRKTTKTVFHSNVNLTWWFLLSNWDSAANSQAKTVFQTMVKKTVAVGALMCLFANHLLDPATQDSYLLEARQQYAQETELSRRVREWEERIVPVLTEEVNYKLKALKDVSLIIQMQLDFHFWCTSGQPCKVKAPRCIIFFSAFFISNSPTIIDGKFVINCITPTGN